MDCTVVNLHFLVQQKAVTKNLIAGSCGRAVIMYNSLDTTMLVHLLKCLLFWNAIPISNCSFRHYFPHSWELKTFTVTWPSQYRISHFLWQNTKSIRPTLTTEAPRMASRFPSAQLIPFYLSIWPQTSLGDCEAVRGPFYSHRFLSHVIIKMSNSYQIMIDDCKGTGWRNAILFKEGGDEIDTVVILKRSACQIDWQGCLEGRRKNLRTSLVSNNSQNSLWYASKHLF